MSLEELERELTSSPPSSTSTSTSPRPTPAMPHPQSLSPSHSPAHHAPPPSSAPPLPPPGIVQHPPPGLPHPLPPGPGVRVGVPPMMPWPPPHVQGGRGHPPLQGAFRPLMPRPSIPLLRQGILTPGHLIRIPGTRPPFPVHPVPAPYPGAPPPMLPAHPLFNHVSPNQQLVGMLVAT